MNLNDFNSCQTHPKFQDHSPITEANNSKILLIFIEKCFKTQLETIYGSELTSRLLLACALLYTKLAQSHSQILPPLTSVYTPSQNQHADQTASKKSSSTRRPSSIIVSPTTQDDSESRFSFAQSSFSKGHPFFHALPSTVRKNKSSIKLALLYNAEVILGTLSQKHRWEEGSDGLEMKVQVLLGLVQVSIAFHQSITAYQCSVQALRLLQALKEEECKSKGNKHLKDLDVCLWLECQYWMVHSVVGLEGRPGGKDVLMEVEKRCEECERYGGVEMVAEIEYAAAEHAMSLMPCQLQTATRHAQVHILHYHSCHASYRSSMTCSTHTILHCS